MKAYSVDLRTTIGNSVIRAFDSGAWHKPKTLHSEK
jgi:hypothetical protein